MHKVDIQFASAYQPASYDVLVNGDHYLSCHTHDDAITTAREAANEGRTPGVIIRDFTRKTATAKFTVVEQW